VLLIPEPADLKTARISLLERPTMEPGKSTAGGAGWGRKKESTKNEGLKSCPSLPSAPWRLTQPALQGLSVSPSPLDRLEPAAFRGRSKAFPALVDPGRWRIKRGLTDSLDVLPYWGRARSACLASETGNEQLGATDHKGSHSQRAKVPRCLPPSVMLAA
jgi:hypothetical protein